MFLVIRNNYHGERRKTARPNLTYIWSTQKVPSQVNGGGFH